MCRAAFVIGRGFCLLASLGLSLGACGRDEGGELGTGGARASGGLAASGGDQNAGGSVGVTGGAGGSNGSGGLIAGGGSPSGGASPSGGSAAGGSSGATNSGGAASGGAGVGGTSGAGGSETGGSGGQVVEACPSSATLGPGDTTLSLMFEGQQRTLLVHAPPGYDGVTRVPVVLDFHGLSGNSNQQKGLSNWDDVADENGFLAVYPQGVDNAWNAGQCCTEATDDVSFVRSVIEELSTQACIDSKRIYASGCSNGGGMSYKLACKASDVIAGIAPVDFDCVDGANCADCDPSRAVPVIQFRGTADTLVDFDGAGPFAGAQENFSIWSGINMCSGAAETYSDNTACEIYPTCGAGADTALCVVEGGTHCGSYTSFMIPQVAWTFLQQHSLP